MADKTPVRVVFNSSNVATGMAEFQSGETVPVAHGGTGITAIGSAGQVLKVNAAGNGLEFSGEGDLSITNLVAPSNADLNLRTSGTGGIILNDITISDNAISTNRSNDDFKINASGTGTVNLENLKIGTSGATVTTILDEDNLSSDSATSLATQQSIKAYVDSEVSAVSTTAISQGDSNVTVADSGTGNVTLEVDGTDRITILAATTTTATGHSLVIGAGSNSTAGQIKFLEGTDNGTNGATLIGPASTADVTVTLPAATDTLVGKATTDTFTNKTFDVEGTGNSISNIDVADLKSGVLDTDLSSVSGSDDTLASAKAIKAYVDANAGGGSSLGDLTAVGSTLSSPSNADITIQTSGSGNVVVENLSIAGDGAVVTGILDEDAMGSNSNVKLATQQSIKAYVDAQDAAIASDTLTLTNKTFDVEGTGNSISNIDVADLKSGVLDTDISSVSGSDDTLASAKAIKTYVDAQVTAQDLDFATDDSTALNIDLDSETLQVSGGANITTSGSGNTITIALDTTLSGLSSVTSTALVTNKISSADSTAVRLDDSLNVDGALDVGGGFTISNTTSVTSIVDEDAMGSNSATALATQQSIKAYVDAQDAAIASDTLTLTNKTFDVEGTGNSISNIDVADLKSGVLDTDLSSVSGSDDTLASAKAIKTYVDAQVTDQDLDVAADDSTAIAIDLDSEVLQVSGGAGITTSATGNTITVSMDTALTVNSLVSSDSSSINIKDGLDIDGTLTLASGTGVNNILDEDDMSSNSATALATQQSIKAYVDAQDAAIASDTLTLTNKTFDVEGTGNSISNIDVADFKAAAIVIESEGIGSNDNDTTLPTSAAVKDYADTKAVLTGSTNNTIATVTGAHALNGEANLTFDGSTLAVTGAATVSTTLGVTGASTLDGVTITDNTISTNASNAPLEIIANGTGPVVITSGGVAFTLPTTDGSAGEFLKTDGSGTLSFGSSTTTSSDDTRVVTKNNKSVSTSPRTVDYFQSSSADMAWYFIALNDLTNDRSSASCFTVAHNNTDAFVSGARGGSSGSNNSLPTTTADISSGQVRVKIAAPSADSKISYYKIPISRANTSDATAGVTVTTSNTDVDSGSEVIDTFVHGTHRAAKYTILIDNNSKTETGVIEALVVHDGSEAFISQYGIVNTGNNDMITLTAQIVSNDCVVSASGLEPNLSLKIHKTLLSDSMSAVSNSNQKIIGATTVSSSATSFDNFDLDDATAAMYYVVGGNSSEGEYSLYEVFCAGAPGEASVTPGSFVSTKGTTQLEFTAGFKSDADNSLELSVSSTSGGSTVVNAYRINCLAE